MTTSVTIRGRARGAIATLNGTEQKLEPFTDHTFHLEDNDSLVVTEGKADDELLTKQEQIIPEAEEKPVPFKSAGKKAEGEE